MDSHRLFSETSPLKLFFLASIPGAISMLASSGEACSSIYSCPC